MQTAAPAEGGGAKCLTKSTGPDSYSTRCCRLQADVPPNWFHVGSLAAAILARRFDITRQHARVVAELAGLGGVP